MQNWKPIETPVEKNVGLSRVTMRHFFLNLQSLLQIPRLDPPIVPPSPAPEPLASPAPVPTPPVSSDLLSPPADSDLDPPIALRKGRRSCYTDHPLHKFINYSRLSPSHRTFVSSLSSLSIPNTIAEAIAHPGWRAAMQEEMHALHSIEE